MNKNELKLNHIYQGDCLAVLKTFSDECIDSAVTSPPYFGLRDYQTAKWEGGDVNCYHSTAKVKSRYDYSLENSHIQDGERKGTDAPRYKNICPTCGAKKVDLQIGLEESPEKYVEKLVEVFREVKRVLKPTGTLWLNIGDSYWANRSENGLKDCGDAKFNNKELVRLHSGGRSHDVIKPKDLIGIPWMLAFALRADGWYLRQDIIWNKTSCMPESVLDRCTKSFEYIFLLSKNSKYFFDNEAIKEKATGYDGRKDTTMKGSEKYKDGNYLAGGSANSLSVKGRERWQYKNLQDDGQKPNTFHENRLNGEEYMSPVRNKRSVWTVSAEPFRESHFATFPKKLITPCILAGTSAKGNCAMCGRPYRRNVEKGNFIKTGGTRQKQTPGLSDKQKNEGTGYRATIDNGWIKDCDCQTDEIVKAVVLDPFGGANTTGLVCQELGRNWISIELNPEYVKMGNRRVSQKTLMI